jgi:hypothetical protein
MRRRTAWIIAPIVLAGVGAGAALGCGGPAPSPLYVERHGGTAAELAALYRGRLGMVTAGSPARLLYLDWRLLHGLRIGEEAGSKLTEPCCDTLSASEPQAPPPRTGADAWFDARALVPGAPAIAGYIATDRPGPDYTRIPNCFDDAFDNAAATLRDRVAHHGAEAPAIRAWLATQDAVFAACGSADAALPPPMANPPAWLAADRAYQEAAFALYNFRTAEAASRFAAIGRDRNSPWQPMGLYLGARAFWREALANKSPQTFAFARAAIGLLDSAPASLYGHAQAQPMLRALAFRDRPAELLAELDHELNLAEPPRDIDLSLTDYLRLGARATAKPAAADWIQTIQAEADHRVEALDHARERWTASQDPAWLIAALSLVNPGEAAAAPLAADAARIAPDQPAWMTAQYHAFRLTTATADPAATRARLDAILARPDLSLTERNLFMGVRMQVATDLTDFARFALRRPYCIAFDGDCEADNFATYAGTLGRRGANGPWVGLGADARAAIDLLPLADRIALSRNPSLPTALRLDIALTGFARAVQLQDGRGIDMLATDLATYLPQLRQDLQAIAAAAPGPAKRFAAYFVMAKIPGLRSDLAGYTRPEGSVPQFQGQWVDWMILPRGQTAGAATGPSPSAYLYNSDWLGSDADDNDLICLGECGPGAFPARLPPFAAASRDRARAEQAALVTTILDAEGHPRTLPRGTVSAWDEALAYARAHPRDPRAPELFYWLIHVARWGGNHDHLGRRAFQLLHARYPASSWARRSPYYYDDPVYPS